MRSAIFVFFAFTLISAPLLRADPATTQPSAAELKLASRIDELSLEGLTVQQVFLAIQDKTRLNLVGDWRSLRSDLDRKLHGRLINVTVREAIDVALSEAGQSSPTDWLIKNNIVTISAPPRVENRVYKIDKLLATLKEHQVAPKTGDKNDPAPVDDVGPQLLTAIETTVDTDSWRDAGGTIGSIRLLGDRLIITQTPETLAKIEQFLRDLETPRGH